LLECPKRFSSSAFGFFQCPHSATRYVLRVTDNLQGLSLLVELQCEDELGVKLPNLSDYQCHRDLILSGPISSSER
jgi:hypothetical protein